MPSQAAPSADPLSDARDPLILSLSEPVLSDAAGGVEGEADWARPMAERHLAMLGALAEAALKVALTLQGQITGPVPGPVEDPVIPSPSEPVLSDAAGGVEGDEAAAPIPPKNLVELGLAFTRAARAVRMTIALRDRMIEALQDHDRRQASGAAREAIARQERAAERRARVERIVWRTVTQTHHDSDDETFDTVERLYNEAVERLEDEDLFDVLARPVSDTIADLCQALGLSPDWPTLAEEAWARAEMRSGEVGSPLAAFSSPASGGGGPAKPVVGAQGPPLDAPSVTALRAAPPSPHAGEEMGLSP